MTHSLSEKSKVESRKLKVKVWAWMLFLLAFNFQLSTPNCFPATKVFFKNQGSSLGAAYGMVSSTMRFWRASAVQGTSKAGIAIDSIAGPVTGQYWPSSTVGHILTDWTSSSVKDVWVSSPLASGVTIAGTITPNIWGFESAVQCNCAFRYEVLRWAVAEGGIVSSLGISTDDGATEWGTTADVRTAPTLTPTSTDFVTGDRIVIVIYNDDGNGVTEASGQSWMFDFDDATGVDGDTYFSFTETITFSADSNTGRARAGGTN